MFGGVRGGTAANIATNTATTTTTTTTTTTAAAAAAATTTDVLCCSDAQSTSNFVANNATVFNIAINNVVGTATGIYIAAIYICSTFLIAVDSCSYSHCC